MVIELVFFFDLFVMIFVFKDGKFGKMIQFDLRVFFPNGWHSHQLARVDGQQNWVPCNGYDSICKKGRRRVMKWGGV